jgi:hypothetical protein
MRAKPTDANLVLLKRRIAGKWSFDVLDICRWLKCSRRTAQRYVAKLKEMNAVEQMLFLENRYYQYRLRREDGTE